MNHICSIVLSGMWSLGCFLALVMAITEPGNSYGERLLCLLLGGPTAFLFAWLPWQLVFDN